MDRRQTLDWPIPGVLVPAAGELPPAVRVLPPRERILHVALRDAREKQPGLEHALRSIATQYGEVDWLSVESRLGPDAIPEIMLGVAKKMQPTLVFMQLQRATTITPDVVDALRLRCDPGVVIINWDGDQHYEPRSAQRRWFVDLGKACDTSLVVNTKHPIEYAELGVRLPGYLQIGIDEMLYRRVEGHPLAPRVALLASAYATNPAYAQRRNVVECMTDKLGSAFGVYGHGWSGVSARPMLRQDEEAGIYNGAHAAISMSIRADLPRYSSDRLFRALASGAYVLVETFPDMEGLGLRDGINCRIWSTRSELVELVETLSDKFSAHQASVRAGAECLGQCFHSWPARMTELLAIVDTVRGMQ